MNTARKESSSFGLTRHGGTHGDEVTSTGVDHDANGYTALTLSASKTFKTARGAIAWLAARGYDAHGVKVADAAVRPIVYGVTESGARVPAVRADSIRPGDSIVERDGYMVEVASVEPLAPPPVGQSPYSHDHVVLTFRSFGPSRISPKTYRSDALVCVVRGQS